MQPPGDPTVVAFFVRVPVPGRVKTRLANVLGDQGACQLYQAMVSDILAALGTCSLPIYLFHDGREDDVLPAAWMAAASRSIAQKGGDIGERMAAAFEHCFGEGIKRVILVGSDIPGLEARIIKEAAAALARQDAVLVPVVDGGYCLIGLHSTTAYRQLFAGIPWSTDQVLEKTLERFAQGHLSVVLLPALQDIDTIEDLDAYCRKPCASARATNRALSSNSGMGGKRQLEGYQRSK